jgi:hypothetical protein
MSTRRGRISNIVIATAGLYAMCAGAGQDALPPERTRARRIRMDGKTEKCPQCGGQSQGLAVMCGPANGSADDEMKCRMAVLACDWASE